MRLCRVLMVLGLFISIEGSLATPASAADQPSSEAKQARERFAKLLLPDGLRKRATKAAVKPRGVVVNAFAEPPGTPTRPGRPGNRP